jgi:hypothetical protein
MFEHKEHSANKNKGSHKTEPYDSYDESGNSNTYVRLSMRLIYYWSLYVLDL